MTQALAAPGESCGENQFEELVAEIRFRHRGLVREFRIERVGEMVILHGRASSFYGKQMVQEEVSRRGNLLIQSNQIQVCSL